MKIQSALAAIVVTVSCAAGVTLGAQDAHQHGAHRHPAAAKVQNPVKADATSIAAGQKLYEKHCAGCHGETGKGDGSMGEDLNPKPSNLTDADWKHGSTDGEIFLVIRDGSKNTGMKGFGKKVTAHQIWDVVNYIRSIGPAKSH